MTEPASTPERPWGRWLARWPLLRRLPLLGVIGLSAYLFAAAHGEGVTLRYVLPAAGATALRTDLSREGRLYRHTEWRFDGRPPSEKLQRLELPHGKYTVQALVLGTHGREPAQVSFEVSEAPLEVSIDLR